MFLDNKYSKWYNALLDFRAKNKADGYTEKHHRTPKSLGGSDDEWNLVRLTAREHVIAHMLLVRMLPKGKARAKMAYALCRMLHAATGRWASKKYIPRSSILYAQHKTRISESTSGEANHNFGIKKGPMSDATKAKLSASRKKLMVSGEVQKKISAALIGRSFKRNKPMSNEQKAMVSAAHKGKKISDEQKMKLSLALKGKKQNHKPVIWTDEMRAKRSASMLGKPQGSRSEETKRKIGQAHKGKKISDEQKKLISERHLGRVVSEETKQKMRQAGLGRPKSEETKQKMKDAWALRKGVRREME